MFMHTPPPPPPQPMPITIFVHGTQMAALFNDVDMSSVLPQVGKTPPGLIAAQDLPEDHLVRNMLHVLATADSKQFPFAGMYTFGWTGGIQVQERCAAGKALFELIRSLSLSYEELHGSRPHITLITHSHGGNVSLHMAEHAYDPSIRINRTLLLACPVQPRTAHNAQHPLFEKIYSIHSHDDQIQIMDQGSLQILRSLIEKGKQDKWINIPEWRETIKTNKWELGSDRHFGTQNNLLQANITWNQEPVHEAHSIEAGLKFELHFYKATHLLSSQNRGVLHTEFTTPVFFQQLSTLLGLLDTKWAASGTPSACLQLSIAGS